MTLRWIEGFEARIHETLHIETYGQDGKGSYTGAPFSGTAGRKQGISALAANFANFATPLLVASPTNTWTVQWAWLKPSSTSISGTPTIRFFKQASGLQMELRMVDGARQGTYAIEAFRGAVSLGQTRDFAYGGPRTWMVFQATVVVRTGVNGSINIKSWDYNNNVTTNELNLAGIDTADQASDGMDQVGWAINTQLAAGLQLDDVIVMDDAGSINNAQTSTPLLVYAQLPIGDGPTVDWDPSSGSTHFNLLDSLATEGSHGNDAVTSDTLTELDQLNMQSVPLMSNAGTPPIIGMQVDIHGAMRNSGSRTLRVNIDDPVGGNADVATNLTFSNLLPTARSLVIELNPVSAAAWTLADLEDHRIGFKLHA